MLTRCPGCSKEIEETLSACPHCKRDFAVKVKGSGRRVAPIQDAPGEVPRTPPEQEAESELPPHMIADMQSQPADLGNQSDLDKQAESVLPPHMLATGSDDLAASAQRRVDAEAKGSPAVYVAAGFAVCAAIVLLPKFFKKEDPPKPPKISIAVTAEPAEPDEPVPGPDAAALESAAPKEPEKSPEKEEKKEPPPIEADDDVPPALDHEEAPEPKNPRGKKRTSQADAAPAVADDPPPAPVSVSNWRITGQVLDLVTLKPVADAELTFVDAASGKTVRTATGADGTFRGPKLPPTAAGYELTISHPDYDSKYLEEHGQKSMSEDQRKEIAQKLMTYYPKNPPINLGTAEQAKKTYVLLPRPKHGMSMEEVFKK